MTAILLAQEPVVKLRFLQRQRLQRPLTCTSVRQVMDPALACLHRCSIPSFLPPASRARLELAMHSSKGKRQAPDLRESP